jgi:hypothetical protein
MTDDQIVETDEAEPPDLLDPEYELSYLLKTLAELSADIEAGSVEDHAKRLQLLDQLDKLIRKMKGDIQLVLADEVTEPIHVEGVGWLVRDDKESSAGSDWQGLKREAIRAAAKKAATDSATGEINPHDMEIAREALDLLDECISLGGPKVGLERRLNVDRDMYVTRSWTKHVVLKESPE